MKEEFTVHLDKSFEQAIKKFTISVDKAYYYLEIIPYEDYKDAVLSSLCVYKSVVGQDKKVSPKFECRENNNNIKITGDLVSAIQALKDANYIDEKLRKKLCESIKTATEKADIFLLDFFSVKLKKGDEKDKLVNKFNEEYKKTSDKDQYLHALVNFIKSDELRKLRFDFYYQPSKEEKKMQLF